MVTFKKLVVKLQKKVNQLNQIGNAEQAEKERETLQLENKKEREIILAEKEKDLVVTSIREIETCIRRTY